MKKLNNKGFTLIEMVIVIVIIAILAAMLVPSLLSYVDNANRKSFLSACDTIKTNALAVSSENYADGNSATLSESDMDTVEEKLGDSATVTLGTAAATTTVGSTKNNYTLYVNDWKDMTKMTIANGSYWGVFENGSWTVYPED